MLGDQYSDTRERVPTGVGGACAQFVDIYDRSAAQLNDVRSHSGDAERRIGSGLGDAHARFTEVQRRGYASAERVYAAWSTQARSGSSARRLRTSPRGAMRRWSRTLQAGTSSSPWAGRLMRRGHARSASCHVHRL